MTTEANNFETQVSVRFPADDVAWLRDVARRRRSGVAAVVRELVGEARDLDLRRAVENGDGVPRD